MRAWGAFLAVGMFAGCQPHKLVRFGELEVYESLWKRADGELRQRAAIDLTCSPDQVQLAMVRKQGKYPTSVHAVGCGNQALYTRKLRRSKGHYTDRNSTWMQESRGVLPPGSQPVEHMQPVAESGDTCTPLPALPRGCFYTHYHGFMKYDAERVFTNCHGSKYVDVTAALPAGSCEVPR